MLHVRNLAAVLAASAGLVGAVGCGGAETRASTTQTTAAELANQQAQTQVAEVTRERDEARAELKSARAAAMQHAIQRGQLDVEERRQREGLATKAWNALDNADDELTPIRDRAMSASADERARLERIIQEPLQKKGHVKANLETLTCAQVLDWGIFKAQTEQAIAALGVAVKDARAAAGTAVVEEPPAKPSAKRAAAKAAGR